MKQTAVQELIDFIESQEYNFLNKEQLESCNKIKEKAEQLLQTEKQNIEDSFVAGDNRGTGNIPFNAEQYYSQEYTKQKEQ